MLHHVDGEQLTIQPSERGCDGEPDQEHSHQKAESAERRYVFHATGTKAEPSPQVNQRGEKKDQSKKHGLERFRSGMM
jgi:hypothetical protein